MYLNSLRQMPAKLQCILRFIRVCFSGRGAGVLPIPLPQAEAPTEPTDGKGADLCFKQRISPEECFPREEFHEEE